MRNLMLAAAVAALTAFVSVPAFAFGNDTTAKAYGGDAESTALAGAKSKAVGVGLGGDGGDGVGVGIGKGGKGGDAHNFGIQDTDLTAKQKTKVGVDTDVDQDNLQLGIQGQKTVQKDGDITIGGDETKNSTTVLNLTPVQLASLPAATCAGSSATASLNGGYLTAGGGLGFGSASESDDCNTREAIKLGLALGLMSREEARVALSKLTGMEHLAPAEEREQVSQATFSSDEYDYGRD